VTYVRTQQIRVSATVLTILFASFAGAGCSNISRYLSGPAPVAAFPPPTWSISGPVALVKAFTESHGFTISGTVAVVFPGSPPEDGFRLALKDVTTSTDIESPYATIEVSTWTRGAPVLETGERVTVAVSDDQSRELIILDSEGLVFHAFVGELFPTADDAGPALFATTHEPIYSNTTQSRDLCVQTWVHQRIQVTTDFSVSTLAPGGSMEIDATTNGRVWTWLIASADSSFLDETDCPGDKPPQVFFVLARQQRTDPGRNDFNGIHKITR